MELSSDLVSQFVKSTKDEQPTNTESTVYGIAKISSSGAYVLLDGGESPTPCSYAVNAINGDRVIVTISNHKAVVTSNVTNPNLSTADVISYSKETPNSTVMQGVVISDSTLQNVNLYGAYSVGETLEDAKIKGSYIDGSTFENGSISGSAIDTSAFTNGQISGSKIDTSAFTNGQISGSKIDTSAFTDGQISGSKIDTSTFTNGQISGTAIDASTFTNGQISGTAIDASTFTNGQISGSKITDASIEGGKIIGVSSAQVTDLRANYATIDGANIEDLNVTKFVSNIGIINDAMIKDGVLTGKLTAVEINADYITSGTLATDRLLVKGNNGLYYKLNVNALGEATISSLSTEDQEKLQNGIHGSNIIAKTITASSISCSDLAAFEATIGGFNITENSLYSGAKSSVGNAARGIYLDNTGQVSFGDSSNFVAYYKNTNDEWKLKVCADVVELGNGLDLSDVANYVTSVGRNLYFGTQYFDGDKWEDTLKEEWQTWDIDPDIGFREYGRRGTWQGICQEFYPEVGQTYTLSFWARGYDGASINVYGSWDETSISPSVIELGPVTDEYVRYSATFTANVDTAIYPRVENTVEGAWLQIYGLQLEKGSEATDWTPAQKEIIGTAESIRNDLTTAIASTSSELRDKIDENNDAVNQKLGEINKYIRFVNGDIVLGAENSELVLSIIGPDPNDSTTPKVSFTQSGVEVAYFSDNNLYINQAEVLTTLRVGNYEFAPRNDGGLALRKWSD